MKQYDVLISIRQLDVLPKTGKRRTAIKNFIEALENFYTVEIDFVTTDPDSGRPLMANNVAGFTIYGWHDGADDDVKVVKIKPTDEAM